MPDYTKYTFDDFILDDRFRRWVLTDSPTEDLFWSNWLQVNSDKLDVVLAARQFVSAIIQAQEELSDAELAEEIRLIQENRVKSQSQVESERANDEKPVRWSLVKWLNIAATLTLVGFLGTKAVQHWYDTDSPLVAVQKAVERQTGKLQEVQNLTNASQLVRLPDGSKVTLYRKSQLSFPRQFSAGKREVFLVGEAFFDVVRRPKQPFMVYTNQLTTQVLGTSFTVRAYPNEKEAKVIVRTGKVSVFRTPLNGKLTEVNDTQPALILMPNQQVIFEDNGRQLERSLVALPEQLGAPVGQLQTMAFDHTPVINVFKKIEAVYGIMINYDTDLLASCELTAEFSSESLFEKLDLICRATNSHYEVIDAQIIIYSEGCR